MAFARSLLLLWPLCANGFIDQIFEQAFGGGGGGQQFHFQMDDGGSFFDMGGGGRQRREVKWPRGVSDTISKKFSWLKGTEWNWNSWRHVKFEKDGRFDAPTRECQGGQCKWSASKGKIYILWGESGVHEMTLQGTMPTEQDPKQLAGLKMQGFRHSDRERCSAVFVRVFDHDAADLEKDLYDILGLADDADEAQIKKVYRKLSIKYHPDKNPDEESRKKFNEVRDAYEILNDPDKKILYDTGGMEAVKNLDKGQVEKGDDVEGEVQVSLESLYNGGTVKAKTQRRVVCRGCRVKPDSPKCRGCNRCPNEIKLVARQMGPMTVQQQQEVPSKEKCKSETAELDVQIERGMRGEDRVTFPRMAEQRPGMIPGSVILTLKQPKHGKFTRRGDDLHLSTTISLREALLGWSQTIRHLDGHSIEFSTTAVTKPFQSIKIKGEGMPHRDDPATFGDLVLRVEVAFPESITDSDARQFGKILAPGAPRAEL